MVQELVPVRFLRRAVLAGGAMYLPGEIAGVPPDLAAQLCDENDNPTATLLTPKALDAPPSNKMQGAPSRKKENNG